MKKQLLLVFTLLISIGLFAQSYTIKGTVVDETGESIPGVSIVQKGTTNGTVADVDGRFTLRIPDSDKPVIIALHFIGMQTQELTVSAKDVDKELRIVMKEDVALLDEVVVVGYGTSRKMTMTGSVSRVGSSKSSSSSSGNATTKAGLLTAGEVNDFTKWALWSDIVKKSHSAYVPVWKMQPLDRYIVQVTTESNMPVVDATVTLLDRRGNNVWQTRSDNTGKAELWANIYTNKSSKGGYKIVCEYKGEKKEVKKAQPFDKGVNTVKMKVPCNDNNRADVMFIVDATGSMSDEIRYLQAELSDVIQRVKTSQPHLDLRMGSVFYRDKGDEYVTRTSALDSDINKTLDFMKEQRADGGGDTPEAVDEALEEAFKNGGWHKDALARIAFLVLDASCHTDKGSVERMQKQVKIAAEKGIRIVPVVCSGMYEDGEYLMRSVALATNGTTLFLTDDSGIGDTHLKPTTDKLEVEMLNDMIVRLIVQYTKMPDCANDDWVEEDKKEAETDKFIPDPYDSSDLKNESEEDKEEEQENAKPISLTNSDVILAYPNPATDMLQVSIKKDITDLFFMDISGKSLQRHKDQKQGSIATVNVSGYSAGIYFVKAYHGGKWYVQKIIVRGY